MAIDIDKTLRTAVSVSYSRSGNKLNKRERHAVKDTDNNVHIVFDETTQHVGKDGLNLLSGLKNASSIITNNLADTVARNRAEEAAQQSNIDFINNQIAEIEALL